MEEREEINWDELPLKCDCGCEETIHDNVYYDGALEVEYYLLCAACHKYLGSFCYGMWEY